MSWWRRLWGTKRSRQGAWSSSDFENLLIISDVHLGEDLLTAGPESLAEHIRILNRELADFVAHHSEHRVQGRRWHLVINGDLFDFVKVSLQPEPEEVVGVDELSPRIRNTAEIVVWKLNRILEVHRPLFRGLARFLSSGHRITILEGNHDAEFYFEEVQQALRDFLLDEARKLWRREKREPELDPEALAAAVQFKPWFEASAGRYHIEHGHQYDEMCSFEYNLAPVDRTRGEAIATPMSHRLMPYFSEFLGDFSTHGIDHWGFIEWLKLGLSKGPRMIFIMFGVYFVAMWELLSEAGKKRRRTLGSAAPIHAERLTAMALSAGYSVQTLHELESQRAVPAEYSLFKMMRVFYFDRFMIGAAMVVATTVGIAIGGSAGWTVSSLAIVLGLLVLHALGKARFSRVCEHLRTAAALIADKTGARYVVFGHSHRPELIDLKAEHGVGRFGERTFYLNTGSWVTRDRVFGETNKGMTFVEISEAGAFLKRWLGPNEEADIIQSTTGAGAQPETTIETAKEPAT